jgi:hypothetical protein
MTALDIQSHLRQSHAERVLAALEGRDRCAAYAAGDDEEIAAARESYVVAAITEIATLRAELFGAHTG